MAQLKNRSCLGHDTAYMPLSQPGISVMPTALIIRKSVPPIKAGSVECSVLISYQVSFAVGLTSYLSTYSVLIRTLIFDRSKCLLFSKN